MGNSGSTGAQSVEEMTANAKAAQRQNLRPWAESVVSEQVKSEQRRWNDPYWGDTWYYTWRNKPDIQKRIDDVVWKKMDDMEQRGLYLSQKADRVGLNDDESYELEQIVRPQSTDQGYAARKEELDKQYQDKKYWVDFTKRRLATDKFDELEKLKKENKFNMDHYQSYGLPNSTYASWGADYDGDLSVEGIRDSFSKTLLEQPQFKYDIQAVGTNFARQRVARRDNNENLIKNEIAQQIQKDIIADQKKSTYLDKKAAAEYKDPVISSLKNYEGCNSGNQMATQQQQNISDNAVAKQQEEQKIINYGQSNITGAGKKKSIRDQMYLMNKKYIEMIGEDPYKVNFRVETENEMEGGFLSLIMDIIDMGFMIAGLFNKEPSFEEQQNKEYMNQLENDYTKHLDDMDEELMASAANEDDYRKQRLQHIKKLKARGMTKDEINAELDDMDEKRTFYTNIQENLQNQIDEEKENYESEMATLEEQFKTKMLDKKKQSYVDKKLAENPPEDPDEIDALRKDYGREFDEGIRKAKQQFEADKATSVAEEANKQMGYDKTWDEQLKSEREAKIAEYQKTFNDEVTKRYKLMEDKIKSELAGYDGCKSNTSNREKLLHDAKVKIKNDIRAEEEAKAQGVEPPKDATTAVGSGRKRGGRRKKLSYN